MAPPQYETFGERDIHDVLHHTRPHRGCASLATQHALVDFPSAFALKGIPIRGVVPFV